MNSKVSVWLGFAGVIVAGCSMGKDLPQSTRTGQIHDIRIGECESTGNRSLCVESIEPKEMDVRPGDEVRWVNTRKASTKVVFIDSLRDVVSCQKNFTMTSKTTLAKIRSNEYASLCFVSPGAYTYNARMAAPVPGGEINAVGLVRVQ